MPPTQTIPARIFSTPEYRQGYAAGVIAVRAEDSPENPYLPQDLRHLGWADACYDHWSARRAGRRPGAGRREGSRPPMVATAFSA